MHWYDDVVVESCHGIIQHGSGPVLLTTNTNSGVQEVVIWIEKCPTVSWNNVQSGTRIAKTTGQAGEHGVRYSGNAGFKIQLSDSLVSQH